MSRNYRHQQQDSRHTSANVTKSTDKSQDAGDKNQGSITERFLPPQITKIISNINKRYPSDVRRSLPPPSKHHCPAIPLAKTAKQLAPASQTQRSFEAAANTSISMYQRLRTHETAGEHDLS